MAALLGAEAADLLPAEAAPSAALLVVASPWTSTAHPATTAAEAASAAPAARTVTPRSIAVSELSGHVVLSR
jgi:hypothetical protein